MCNRMSSSGTSASPSREPRNRPRGTKCRPDWAGLDCQGGPDNRRRCRQEQAPRPILRGPTESVETPPEANRQGLTRELLDTQTAIRGQPREEGKILTQEDKSRTKRLRKSWMKDHGVLVAGPLNAQHDLDLGDPRSTTSNRVGRVGPLMSLVFTGLRR